MENIEVRYAGIVVGRSSTVRDQDASGAFVGISEPLPVGTIVSLRIGEATKDARVDEVIESADAAAAGMHVRFLAATQATAHAAPPVAVAPPPVATPAKPAAAPAPAPAKPAPVAATPVAPAAPQAEITDGGSDQAGSGESEDLSAPIPASPILAGFGSQPNAGGGGGRRRRRRR